MEFRKLSTHNTTTRALAQPLVQYRQNRKRLVRALRTKRSFRYIAAGVNLGVLGAVVLLVMGNGPASQNAPRAVSAAAVTNTSAANPLDQLSSADIAVSIANMTHLTEATAVKNQAESVNAELAVAPTENVVVSKPQVVATALKSRQDIKTYTTVNGDSVASVAAKFGVTSNSILWSNGLSGTTLKAGVKLAIPPINGIVYTVKSGDTPQSLAAKYSSNADQIIAYNDAEISGLQVGEQIIIPNGQVQTASVSFGFGSGGNFYPSYGSNGYDFGYCTWYVATQVPVPSNWGNASSWAYYAALSGWTVSSTPSVGAIAQTPYAAGGQGHVAMVRAVSADGSQVLIQDMNGIAGWDRVGEAWETTSKYPHYIAH